jgi:protein-disulfide isomerase
MNFPRLSKLLLVAVVMSTLVSACTISPMHSNSQAASSEAKIAALQSDVQALTSNVADMKKSLDTLYKLISSKIEENSPKPAVTAIQLGDDPVLGDRAAKVAVVEFSDYQCPFCGAFQVQTMPGLKKQYIDTGKVQFIYRDFPLDFHPHAESAAIAAHCAGEQNAYWQMHDQLFANQRQLGTKLYTDLAAQLHLDTKRFGACLKEAKFKGRLSDEVKYGLKIGIEGTPAFFIGRIEGDKLVDVKSIVGAQPANVFANLIDSYLD